jgi:hypothetical protein
MKTFHGCPLHLGLIRRTGAALLLATALAWCLPGLCGPIHEAARNGDVKKVELLLKEQPNLISSKEDKYGQTPLVIAAFNNRLDVAKLLLTKGADVQIQTNNGSTALHLAAAKGNLEMVKLLLEHKALINALDRDGWSPMHSALTYGHQDVADFLSEKGGKDIPAPKPVATTGPVLNKEKAPPHELIRDGQFVPYDDGTILDTKTNLMWTTVDNGAALSRPGVQQFVTTYPGAGYKDWRLPTPGELAGLYDKDKTIKTNCPAAVDALGQAADEIHLATDLFRISCTRMWSSKASSETPGTVTLYDFHSGAEVTRPGTDAYIDQAARVLLVRSVTK